MDEDLQAQIDSQQDTLMELEEELELEISRVIALKNKLDPELIEELEKIEEGLYVEVKMIHETKLNFNTIMESMTKDNGTGGPGALSQEERENIEEELEKYKKRTDKLVKQLIQANEEIEELTNNLESELKARENQMKNQLITELQEKERLMNQKHFESQRQVEELKNQLESYKRTQMNGSGEIERMKSFFDKKIRNVKESMIQEFKEREREIAKKAIIVYNKKKEKIYYSTIKEILRTGNYSAEIESVLKFLRQCLDLSDDVYGIQNFSLCNYCGELVHISQTNCSNCNMKIV